MVLLAMAAAAPAWAQESVIRIDVKLVQVDAVVTDSRNKHVGNLKADDFEILQDGKPQTITNFSYIAPSVPPATSRGPAIAIAPRIAPAPLKASDVRRMVALVVDDLALSSDGVAHVRDALRKFASRELQPGDRVAVIRTSAGMGALQQFTTDRTMLNAAIDQIKFTLGRVSLPAIAATRPQSPQEEKADAAGAKSDQFERGALVSGMVGTLRYVLEGFRDMPGRKSVVLFCENLPLPDATL